MKAIPHPARLFGALAIVIATALATACSSNSSSTTAGVSGTTAPGTSQSVGGGSGKTVTIGVVAALTGPLAVQWLPSDKAFNAAIDKINAAGGADGYQIKVITEDDGGTPTGNLAAAQSLVEQDHVVLVADFSEEITAAVPYLYKAGIPTLSVCQASIVAEQPYTNNFCASGSFDPNPQTYTTDFGIILKDIGCKDVGGLGLGVSAAAQAYTLNGIASAKYAGLASTYLNNNVGLGVTNWTPYVLGMKASNVDCVFPILEQTDEFNFLSAAKTQGLDLKAFIATGYSELAVQEPAVSEDQGIYVGAKYQPSQLNTPATIAENAALKKYSGFTYPAAFAESQGYATGLLAGEAIQVSRSDLTGPSITRHLRAVTNWTADGLEPAPVDFATDFGTNNGAADCQWYLQIKGTAYVPQDKEPICGVTKTS